MPVISPADGSHHHIPRFCSQWEAGPRRHCEPPMFVVRSFFTGEYTPLAVINY